MLFVWLMSLGIGVANACLLQQDHGRHGHARHSHSGPMSLTPMRHEVTPGRLAAAPAQVDQNDKSPEKLACSNFCVAAQSALVKDPMDGCTAPDMVPVATLAWLLVPPVDQVPPLATLERPTGSDPPVSIRFLRLTI